MVDNSTVSPRLIHGDVARRIRAMLAIAFLWLGLMSRAASARGMQVSALYSEPDVRELGAAVTLLLRDQLRELRPPGRVTGTLSQLGSTLTATVVVYGEGDAMLAQVTASAPYGRVDVLAEELGRRIAEALGADAPKPAGASTGELLPFLAAEAALARGEPIAAAQALSAAPADAAVQAPSVKAIAAKLAADESVPLEDRVHAALIARDYARVRALAEERLAAQDGDAIARAAMARYHLALFNSQAAGAALVPLGSSSGSGDSGDAAAPFVVLARALMAPEDERAGLLAPLLTGKSVYVPAAVMLAGLPPKALGSRHVRVALAAARSLSGSHPALASALGLAAARAKAGNDALDLIEVVWLRPADLAVLELLVEEAIRKRWPPGLRLRAELRMRAGDTKGALEDAQKALAERPGDPRLVRYVAWLLADQGKYTEAAQAWRKVERTLDDRDQRHLARMLAAAGQSKEADAIWRGLGDATSIESQVAVSRELIELGKPAEAVVILERLAVAAPESAAVLTALAAAYLAAERPDDKVTIERRLAALTAPDKAREAEVTVSQSALAPAGEPGVSVETVTATAELVHAIRPVVTEALRPLTDAGVTSVAVLLPHERTPRLTWPHVEHPEPLTAAVSAVLRELGMGATPLASGRPPSDCRREKQELAAIAQAHEVDAVLTYTLASRFGGRVDIAVCLVHGSVIDIAQPKTPLSGRDLGLLSRHRPFYYGLGGAAALVLLVALMVLLVPRGTIVVTLKPDSDAKNETYELLISRSPTPPVLTDPEAFTRRLSRAGYTKSRRRASMVSVTTAFSKLPAGTWYVHLTGTYEKGNALRVYNGERTRKVQVRAGKRAEVTFQLAADAAEYHITVVDTHGPLSKAVVWVDSHRDRRGTTDKEGKLVIEVPLGEHVIHVEAKGDFLHKQIVVSNTEVSYLSIHFDRERRLAGGISIDGISDSGISDGGISDSGVGRAGARARSQGGQGGSSGSAAEMRQSRAPALAASHAGLGRAGGRSGEIVDPTAKTEASLAGGPGAAPAASASGALSGLSRYALSQELGRGAMGVVYRAHDRVLERDVAVKIMRDEIRHHEIAWQLFVQEAKALAALNHPNIVAVYDKGQDAEQPFIVMELVEGTTIETLLGRQGRFELGQALALADQLCAGLAYAHSRRVVHRDIKPGNMFLTGDGIIKLTDFGLARILDELRIHQTEVRGTPAYMSPEQVLGTDIDFRADLYAVGCTLYEMVTGRPPFVSGELFYHHVHTPPERPSAVASGIPPSLERLILLCLEKQKEQRIQSAEAIRQAIAAIFAEFGGTGAARLAMQRTKLYGS